MAILDLSAVTSSLQKLLKVNLDETYFDGNNTVTVTPEPPEAVGSVTNTLSMFLYHVGEEAFYKNFEGPGNSARNIAETPMALCLYYILTPHHDTQTPQSDSLTQQKLMGYALKTLHDYSVVDDDTMIANQTILQGEMHGNYNTMQIILRPVTPEEAISFWGAEDQQTARLSAYYEVRVILLEPDDPPTVAGPVLSLGTYLYQLGTPHLDHSESALPFTLPSSGGGTAQLVEVTPARVSGDDGDDPPHNRLELTGSNLAIGQSRQLWLRGDAFTTVGGSLPVDLSLANNTDNGWALTVSDDKLVLDVFQTLYYLDSSAMQQNIALLPGIYTAFLRVTMQERVVGNALVPITNDSNEVALVVIPRIADDTPDNGTNKVDLTIVATFDLTLASLDIRLYVDGEGYTEVAGTLVAGEYEILTATTLRFHARFTVNADAEHAARLIVNGAESAPYWIETTAS
jgi:hypothetical protein